MLKIFSLAISLTLFSFISVAQDFDNLKLSESEIPAGYSRPAKILCKTVHSVLFYDQTDIYSTFLGSVVKKDFQAFEKKGDKGSILYFEFDRDFTSEVFLEGLLWGDAGKPTKHKPDDYIVKGKFLIIWSFGLDSEIKKISKAKLTQYLL